MARGTDRATGLQAWGRRAVIAAVLLAAALAGAVRAGAAPPGPWMNTSLSPGDRASLLVAQMTLDEKISMVHGAGFDTTRFFGCVGYIPANTRLGIPALCLGDGPDGVGNGNTGVTQWPASISNASSWDRRMLRSFGAAYGAEQAGKGRNIALAPTINILRTPLWGRSFETFTEDPFLNGQLAVSEIHGIQSRHVIATPKHFVANNQEILRNSIDVRVSQRALHEIYYPGFEAAVTRGGAGAVMCSYNRINGPYACEAPDTLNTALKGLFGFDGFVMSDWGATHSTVDAANGGLDMEMPGGTGGFFGPEFFGQALKDAVLAGQVPEARLDDMVHRTLTSMFRIGLFDHPTPDPATTRTAVVTSPGHQRLATRLSQSGTVLLRNAGGVLPLDAGSVSSIAVIGDDARDNPQTQGGGSAAVVPSHPPITPLDAITARAGSGVHVSYTVGAIPTAALPGVPSSALSPSSGTGPGLLGTYYATADFSGPPVATRVDPTLDFDAAPVDGLPDTWSAVWTGTVTPPADGTYTFSLTTSGASHIEVDGHVVASNPGGFGASSQETPITLQGGVAVPIRVDFVGGGPFAAFTGTHLHVGWVNQDAMIADAVQAARSADVAVVFANDVASEGSDRPSLELPRWQDDLIAAVGAANPHTVVVLNTSGAVLMPWIDDVAGVLEAWYPGQEDGAAIAPVLFGDVNPSGHLTETFPATASQGPAKTTLEYPGDGTSVFYDEGILVGYRWYQASGEQPLFPFGYGLSYTTFSYANVTATPQGSGGKRRVRVAFDVTNTGSRAGADVAQVYLGLPAAAGEPPKRLAGFEKVKLAPGETRHVTLSLRPEAHPLSFWDEAADGWSTASGTYSVYVGDSSDAPLGTTFQVSR